MVKYPVDWKIIQIKDIVLDIADGPFGSNLKAVHYTNKHEARIIQLSNLGEDGWKDENVKYTTYRHAKKISRSIVPQNNVIMAKMMPAGRTIICPNNENMYVLSSDVIRIQLNDKLVNKIFFVFSTKSHFFLNQLNSEIQGSTRNRTSISKIKKNSILLPSLQEQQAIADTLSTFDTYISNLTELIEKKKAIREGALEDLVSGKTRLEGFGGEWKKGRLLDFTKIKRGKRVVRSQLYTTHKKETFPVYQNSLEPLGYFNDYNCRRNSVFVIAAGNAGDIGFSNENFWAADDCYSFEHTDNVSQKFLLYLLLSRQQEISAQTRRTSIPRLSRDILENLLVMLPKQNEQQAIVNTLTAMDDEIRNLETELDKMKQIREGAMDDLLTGRIRLPL